MGKLAILAGGGELPHIGMKEAILAGEDPLFFSLIESDFYPGEFANRTLPVHVSQVGKILKLLKEKKITELLMLGKVKKELLFQDLKFDLKALSILAKTINRNDYPIFLAVAEEIEKLGIKVISQKKYLTSLLLPEGRYTNSKLSKQLIDDVQFGLSYAKKIAELDIGQLVVVHDKSVIAVEAVEGTDETIQRAGRYLKKSKSGVVCKAGKRIQDERFDLPTIGVHTLKTMVENDCRTLCIEENQTIVVNPTEVIAFANKANINIIVLGNSDPVNVNAKQKKVKHH